MKHYLITTASAQKTPAYRELAYEARTSARHRRLCSRPPGCCAVADVRKCLGVPFLSVAVLLVPPPCASRVSDSSSYYSCLTLNHNHHYHHRTTILVVSWSLAVSQGLAGTAACSRSVAWLRISQPRQSCTEVTQSIEVLEALWDPRQIGRAHV